MQQCGPLRVGGARWGGAPVGRQGSLFAGTAHERGEMLAGWQPRRVAVPLAVLRCRCLSVPLVSTPPRPAPTPAPPRAQSVAHLQALHGNGLPIAIPEDDKMWQMLENGYSSMEFDYASSAEQVAADLGSIRGSISPLVHASGGRCWASGPVLGRET